MVRIHRKGNHPLWFSHDGEGRFDLPPPAGTLYTAELPIGAFVEVFRDIGRIAREDVDVRRLSVLASSRDLVLADCTSRLARRFGVTAAIHSTPAYEESQAWAASFAAAGLHGIRYLLSHDPAQRLIGYALFGPSAAAESGDCAVFETRSLAPDLLRHAREEFDLAALDTLLSPT